MALLSVLAGIIVGAILYLAAIGKALSPTDTENAIGWVFGAESALRLTIALASGEVLLGSILIVGFAPRTSFTLAAVLSLGFLGWFAYLQMTHAPVGCGCGIKLPLLSSAGGDRVRDSAYIRAGVLLCFSLTGLWSSIHLRAERVSRPDEP